MKHVPGLLLAAILILAATSWVQAQELMVEFHDRDFEVHNYSNYSMDTLTATPSSGQVESANLLHFVLDSGQGIEVFIGTLSLKIVNMISTHPSLTEVTNAGKLLICAGLKGSLSLT